MIRYKEVVRFEKQYVVEVHNFPYGVKYQEYCMFCLFLGRVTILLYTF